MNNQAIIECLLDMWLSQKQLKKIKTDWKAFYNDPVKYKDTIVIEMDTRKDKNHEKENYIHTHTGSRFHRLLFCWKKYGGSTETGNAY